MSSNFSAFILVIFIPKKCSTKFSFWWGYWNSLKLSQRHNIVLRIKMTFIGKYLGRPILRWHLTSWSCLTTPAILYHSWICWNERLSILWFHLLMNVWVKWNWEPKFLLHEIWFVDRLYHSIWWKDFCFDDLRKEKRTFI